VEETEVVRLDLMVGCVMFGKWRGLGGVETRDWMCAKRQEVCGRGGVQLHEKWGKLAKLGGWLFGSDV